MLLWGTRIPIPNRQSCIPSFALLFEEAATAKKQRQIFCKMGAKASALQKQQQSISTPSKQPNGDVQEYYFEEGDDGFVVVSKTKQQDVAPLSDEDVEDFDAVLSEESPTEFVQKPISASQCI